MKKLFLAIVLAGASLAASAQTFGIRGGVNFAKLNATVTGASGSASSGTETSFSAGVFLDAPVGSGFSIQPGLFYSGKGGGSNDGTSTGKIKLGYLQLPVNIVYNVPVTGGTVFFGAGPYAAYAISAKAKDGNVTVDLERGSDAGDDIKDTDFGATGLIGFRFTNGLSINANYDLGLSNILPGVNEAKLKNRVIGLSLGFNF